MGANKPKNPNPKIKPPPALDLFKSTKLISGSPSVNTQSHHDCRHPSDRGRSNPTMGGHFPTERARPFASGGLAVLPPYPRHVSASCIVRSPPPLNHLPPMGPPGKPLTALPHSLTSHLRQCDVTSPFRHRASMSPPRHLSTRLPPCHRHLATHVSCHFTLSYPDP